MNKYSRKYQEALSSQLEALWKHIGSHRRFQFKLLIFLSILSSLSEVVSVGAILPFMAALTAPENIFYHPMLKPLIATLKITNPNQLLLPLTLTFIFSVFLSAAFRLLVLWSNIKFSFAVGSDISSSIYQRTLYQPYATQLSRNSSEIINGVSGKANTVIYSVILPILTLLSSSLILIAIVIALLNIDLAITLIAFGSFSLIYIVIILLTRKQLHVNSKNFAIESTRVIKILQESLGGIRDILIDGIQQTYCLFYNKADFELRRAQGNCSFITASPRYLMEALGVLLISLLAYSVATKSNGTLLSDIPVLAALALGAQRMLPALHQVYGAYTQIKSGQASLNDVLNLLEQPLPNLSNKNSMLPLKFNKSINLNRISFRYEENLPYVLKDLNLTIKKGSRVGFVGPSGSGKSTLLDLIMGLLEPTDGTFSIDGKTIDETNSKAWQHNIAHVPQSIFLADSSIEENIAFGVPIDEIDSKQVKKAAKQAKLIDLISSLPNGFETIVGERGARLSGGQRQRIGIARALYKKADVIIFDEATSALDYKTELDVMNAIDELDQTLTILIVAHRITILQKCSKVYVLDNGKISLKNDK